MILPLLTELFVPSDSDVPVDDERPRVSDSDRDMLCETLSDSRCAVARRPHLADDFGFADQLGDIVAREIILKIEKHLEPGVGEEGFPVVLVHRLELLKALKDEEQFDAVTGDLGDGVLDDLHPLQPREFIEHHQDRMAGRRAPPHLLHFRDGQRDHHPQPPVMRAHVPLRQAQVKTQPLGARLQLRELEIRRLKQALHRRAVDELRVPVRHLQARFHTASGEFISMLVKESPDAGDQPVESRVVGQPRPQQPVRRRNILLARLLQRLDRFPVAPRDQFAQGDQVSAPLVLGRSQDVQEQPLDHRPRGFIPERIVAALVDDDNGVGNAPRFVDGFLVFGVQSIERD